MCTSCVCFASSALSVTAYAGNNDDENKSYTIISESNQTPISINSKNIDIDGLVYSNCGIESSDKIENQKNNCVFNYSVTNFSPELMSFDKAMENHENDYVYYGYMNTINSFGLSNIMANNYKLSIDEMFGANEDVTINSAIVNSLADEKESVIFSSNGNILINANIFDFSGIIYAPNGSITINANEIDVYGVIIAQEVKISSTSFEITSNPNIFDEYDIDFYTLDEVPMDIDIMSAGSSSSGSGKNTWYYNTGTSVQTKAVYSKYKLLSTVKRGDIIHEKRSGGVGSITGHIACVEGIYYLPAGSYKNYVYNIRIIEAISPRVCRSVLDDTRCDDNNVMLLRYKRNISSSNMNKVINFLTGQLGKTYKMDMSRNTSYNTTNWYCSELVWAAYSSIGLDIEDGNFGAITPGDIKDSNNTKTVYYK